MKTTESAPADLLRFLSAAWRGLGDRRQIVAVREVSAHVSTNHVYRVELDDGGSVICKVSSYGSYFLFYEDHDRLHQCRELLQGTRFGRLLADVYTKDGDVYTFYDGDEWAVFYDEVVRKDPLPRVLTPAQIENFGEEMGLFHRECARLAPQIPLTSKSIKSDAIHLLDLVSDARTVRAFEEFTDDEAAVVRHHCHEFLTTLQRVRYDYWQKIPVLIDWNLGNFSVDITANGRFKLFSRWDYDWFRIDTRLLDFYFLSRVSSRTGDRTYFTYSSHTLTEPRFQAFIRAYHAVNPLSDDDIAFLKECYRFFILNYVIREGDHFFRDDLWRRLQKEAVHVYLPSLDALDLTPLLDAIH